VAWIDLLHSDKQVGLNSGWIDREAQSGRRIVRWLTSLSMASWQWFGNLHRTIYRLTNGRVGARLAGRPMLLLTTTGRKSGEPRTTPLSYLRDGDDCIIVASNNGADRHPAWWLNLESSPKGQVKVGREGWTSRRWSRAAVSMKGSGRDSSTTIHNMPATRPRPIEIFRSLFFSAEIRNHA